MNWQEILRKHKGFVLLVLILSLPLLLGWRIKSIQDAGLEGKMLFGGYLGKLYLLELSTGRMERIELKEAAFNTVLSPDGTKIAYNNRDGLWVVNVDGRQRRFLTEKGAICGYASTDPQPIAWSPDGEMIAFESSDLLEKSKQGIYLIDVEGKNERFVERFCKICAYKPIPLEGYIEGSTWSCSEIWLALRRKISPDGKRFLFIRHERAPYYKDPNDFVDNIYIADISGLNEICLTPIKEKERPKVKYDLWGVQWSPDGKKLFYFAELVRWIGDQYVHGTQSPFTYPYYLMMMNPDGSGKTKVKKFTYKRFI